MDYIRRCGTYLNTFRWCKKLVVSENTVFTEKELLEFQKLTFLSKTQIINLYSTFCSLDTDTNPKDKNPVVRQTRMYQLPELAVNPFKERIVKIFSSKEGCMSFEDFLEMMSVFQDKAPVHVKTSYAFRIYDFDDDDMLSEEDVHNILKILTRNELTDDDCVEVVNAVFREADLDSDGFITFPEFEHLISKSPDFMNAFRIRI